MSERLASVKERALGDARESFNRAESTNCSQHLSLGFQLVGKEGGGCTLPRSRCCGTCYVLSEGEKGEGVDGRLLPIMPVIP